MAKPGAKLWGGRFSGATDPVLAEYNSSISVDKLMWKEDLQGSVAYAKAICKAGILSKEDEQKIISGLGDIKTEWEVGKFQIYDIDEDIHSAHERRLKEIIGDAGGKLHTGRSRNDQVAVDMHLWMKSHVQEMAQVLSSLLKVICEKAEEEKEILMPGYTHLQRAQPVRWSHWLLSYGWSLLADLERLRNVFRSADVCPLGSGALAGTPLPVDRELLSKDLGFNEVSQNSLLAVRDRDFIVEYLFWASLICVHLSSLAEDLILHVTSEFGFSKLSDAYSTGSSLMPQKKNPDSLELIRSTAGKISGKLFGFITAIKGLPSAYNKDLQEDKSSMFATAKDVIAVIKIMSGVIATLCVNKEKCQSALSEDMFATDIAYYLVRKGVPFRTAHEKAGEVVKLSEKLQCPFSAIPLEKLAEVSNLFTSDVAKLWNFEASVEQYSSVGGTALANVEDQIQKINKFVDNFSI